MPSPFLLDTNAYFLFFQSLESQARLRLEEQLGPDLSFYISEITSMEIHSVLGKYRRGKPRQTQLCDRQIQVGADLETCSNTWSSTGTKRMKRKVFRDLQKLISDVEEEKGSIKANILALDSLVFENARYLLKKYADQYNFGSHDALIGGTIMTARESGLVLTLVTSDRGCKVVLRKESIPVYDPNMDS